MQLVVIELLWGQRSNQAIGLSSEGMNADWQTRLIVSSVALGSKAPISTGYTAAQVFVQS